MTFPTTIDPDLPAAASGIVCALICLLALHRHRLAVARTHAALQSELRSMLREHQAVCSARIEQPGRTQEIGAIAKAGLTRSIRSQAIQLLRSGMPPERAASELGIARREMVLIARVVRTLSLH